MRTSSLIGGMIWLALAIVAGTDAGFFQIIELMFLLAPLVVVPLGFHLLQTGKVWLQLPAALLAAISFAFLPGPLPLLLCVPWLAVTCLAAWDGWKRFSFEPARLCESAALLTLPVGAFGLLQSRFGANPLGFTEPLVLLVAVHFHFTTFAAPVFAGQVGRLTRHTRLFRVVAWAIVGSSPLIALGFIFSPVLKLAAVLTLSGALVVLAGLTDGVLKKLTNLPARWLVGGAAASITIGMMLAGLFGIGEFTETWWLTIPEMARSHGPINGLGFACGGLLGWTLAGRETARSGRQTLTRMLTF